MMPAFPDYLDAKEVQLERYANVTEVGESASVYHKLLGNYVFCMNTKNKSINVFKRILIDYWGEFKRNHTSYDTDYYNEIVEKVINCGDVRYGYTEYMCRT